MANTYTIQFRRGMYADFDASKIRPGEPVAILGNDPSVPSGKALYIAFAANDVRRLCSIEDILEMVNAGEFVGPQGPKGEKGDKGADGTVAFESLTPEQKESLRGISIKSASVDPDGNLTITFSDGDSEDVGNIMGPQGIQGPKGDKGDVGPQGPKGDKGDVGPKGDNMSDEQAQQIKKNTDDVASLREDISTKITKFYACSQGETHLADSDNGKIMDMMVYGRSEQKQYSGKNLLNATFKTDTYSGVALTNNGDGTYTIEGTNNSSGELTFPLVPTVDEQKALYNSLIGKNVKFIVESGSTISGSVGRICFVFYNKTENRYSNETYNGGNVTVPTGYDLSVVDIHINVGQTVPKTIIKPMITTDLTATYDDFEPYTGGIPSPNPDYPQEIKSVVNPTVKVSNEDGTQFKTVTLPYTLNAIPVSSGGNVTIDGQQYIADYVDVEREKLVRMVDDVEAKNYTWDLYPGGNNMPRRFGMNDTIRFNMPADIRIMSSHFKQIAANTRTDLSTWFQTYYIAITDMNEKWKNSEALIQWFSENNVHFYLPLKTPTEIDLTPEEIAAFKTLVTYYPTTNISVNSEQLDGYTVFNYPISMANGWNYVKKQLNDNRDYIYDMDIQSAEAYVNSEYAVALTELEV